MKLISRNRFANDCVIVAAFNALVLSGQQQDYEEITKVAKRFGYTDSGFLLNHLGEFLIQLGAKAKSVKPRTAFSEIEEQVRCRNRVFLLVYGRGQNAHAVILRLINGRVQIINPETDNNWKKLRHRISNSTYQFCAWQLKVKNARS